MLVYGLTLLSTNTVWNSFRKQKCPQSQTFTLTEIIFILFSIFSWYDCVVAVTEYLWVDGVNANKNRKRTEVKQQLQQRKQKINIKCIKYSTEKQKDSLMAHKKKNLIKWVKRLYNNMLIFFLLFCSHSASLSHSLTLSCFHDPLTLLHPPSTHT